MGSVQMMFTARKIFDRTTSSFPSGWKNTILFRGFGFALLSIVPALGVADHSQAGEKEILLGMSTAMTGPAADLGKNMRLGVMTALEQANRSGGIGGRALRLLVLDDGYEPERTAPNMRELIEHKHVLAIIGNVGTPTAIAAIPIANEQRTLFFAPFTGAGVLRKTPPDRYVINYRASYAEETAAMIDALIHHGKLAPEDIAFFTQRDGYGDAGFAGGKAALKRQGIKDEAKIVHVRYERNTLAVEGAIATLLFSEPLPRAIVMVGAYAPCAKFIQLARESGLEALFLNVSFVGSTPLARKLGDEVDRVIVTQVVPHPLKSELPIVREYRKNLQAMDDSIPPTFGGLEGFIATRIFIKAMKNISGPLTKETLIDSLEALGRFDIGLGEPLHFDQHDHQASHRIWPTILHQGEFLPFSWADIPQLVSPNR